MSGHVHPESVPCNVMCPGHPRTDRAKGAWTEREWVLARTAFALLPERLRQGLTDISDGYENTDDAVNAREVITGYWQADR